MDSNKSAYTVQIDNYQVPVLKADHITEDQFNKIINGFKFKDYVKNFKTENGEIVVVSIKILSVFMFNPNVVGFIDIYVDGHRKSDKNKRIPGFALVRGGAISVLVIVNGNQLILGKQYRVPVGRMITECPAGQMDDKGDFTGVAANELKQKLGITVNKKNLIFLGEIYPSPGGCDEHVTMFALELNMDMLEIQEFQAQQSQNTEFKQYYLFFEEFQIQNIIKTKECKILSSVFAYNECKNKQQIQQKQQLQKQDL